LLDEYAIREFVHTEDPRLSRSGGQSPPRRAAALAIPA
jgi:hypothetical protein